MKSKFANNPPTKFWPAHPGSACTLLTLSDEGQASKGQPAVAALFAA
jgi:hypothetical protein